MNVIVTLICCLCLFSSHEVKAEELCSLKRAEAVAQSTLGRLQANFGMAVQAPSIQIIQDIRDLPRSEELAAFGYYDPDGKTLFVVCRVGSDNWFDVAVRHEVTHHYLSQAFGRLPTWLEEGLATYMEVENLEGADLRHYINRPRFNEFINILKRNRLPAIMELITSPPPRKRASQYYAGYWALVFALMHDPNLSVQDQRRKLLRNMLTEPHQDVLTINRRLIDALLLETPDLEQWELRWRRGLWSLR